MRNNEAVINPYSAAGAAAEERAEFIRRTYAHLTVALGAFAVLEYILLGPLIGTTGPLIQMMVGGRHSWLIVLGLFMAVGYVADRWARSDRSVGMQYAGLCLYVAAEAIIFMPLLYVAAYLTDPTVLPTAGLLTLCLFIGLTGTVFITKRDFSFMRSTLMIGGFVALGLIVVATVFGFTLGSLFSLVMVGLAAGYILYYTSNVLHHYRTDQHVAASLALFAAVALMFWYVLRLVMAFSRR